MFAAMRKPESLRLILPLAAKQYFTLRQMDVNLANLLPKIKEKHYLEQPNGFEKIDASGEKIVC